MRSGRGTMFAEASMTDEWQTSRQLSEVLTGDVALIRMDLVRLGRVEPEDQGLICECPVLGAAKFANRHDQTPTDFS